MRLASGICHVLDLQWAGAPVGLGVDGSASNDGGHLLGEARQAMLLQRVAPDRYLSEAPGGRGGFAGGATAMSAREARAIGARGGGAVAGRDDTGQWGPRTSGGLLDTKPTHVPYSGGGRAARGGAALTATRRSRRPSRRRTASRPRRRRRGGGDARSACAAARPSSGRFARGGARRRSADRRALRAALRQQRRAVDEFGRRYDLRLSLIHISEPTRPY